MTYSVRIDHFMKGLSDTNRETVFTLSCDNTEQNFSHIRQQQLLEAEKKYKALVREYKTEVFQLVEFIYEKNILARTGEC